MPTRVDRIQRGEGMGLLERSDVSDPISSHQHAATAGRDGIRWTNHRTNILVRTRAEIGRTGDLGPFASLVADRGLLGAVRRAALLGRLGGRRVAAPAGGNAANLPATPTSERSSQATRIVRLIGAQP